MAYNSFRIPTLDVDLLSWANARDQIIDNRANQRRAELNAMLGNAGNAVRDIVNRKAQEEQAEQQRQFQAAEAEKGQALQEKLARFQAAENDKWRAIEQSKQNAAERNAAETQYMEALTRFQNDPNDLVAQLQLNQLKKQYPNIDTYKPEGFMPGVTKYGSHAEDIKKAAADKADYTNRVASYGNRLPTSFKTVAERQAALDAINGTTFNELDKAKLRQQLAGIETAEEQNRKATQAAVIAHGAGKVTKNLEQNDLTAEVNAAVNNNTKPSLLSSDVKAEILKSYEWDGKKWIRRS